MTTTKFCTVADVKARLTTADGYTGDDTLITSHIEQATALLRQYTRRNWEFATRTQLFDSRHIQTSYGLGQNVAGFTLKEKPLIAVKTVKYHTGGLFADTEALDPAHYTVDFERNRVLIYPYVMTFNRGSLQVTYEAGYQPDGTDTALLLVAPNLKMACAIQAAFTFRRVINENTGNRQKQDKQGAATVSLTSSGLITEALALVKGETRTLVGGNG